mmetsp:Transcript_21148/g.45868  ORF Transcript_21148/g.45868 Transcript_21148/m.45868 type:complete len:227 (+) Transcript_21148:242-922(+)
MLGPAVLEVKDSTIPGAGCGLFAKEPIAPFVVLGEYVGQRCSYTALGAKMTRVGHDRLHAFGLGPNLVMDPTDDEGRLHPDRTPLSFTNEPAPGGEFNALAMYSKLGGPEQQKVYFVTSRQIEAGEELFICYGYDFTREYPIADPDPERDAALRAAVCEKHEVLRPEFPLPESAVETAVGGAAVDLVFTSRDEKDDEGAPKVGTEEWKTDFSDVTLPMPTYDSDSD